MWVIGMGLWIVTVMGAAYLAHQMGYNKGYEAGKAAERGLKTVVGQYEKK